jgi:uncharacterized membrane protein
MIWHLIKRPPDGRLRSQFCGAYWNGFLAAAFLALIGQVAYDQHLITVLSLFPQWLLLGSMWYLWRQKATPQHNWDRITLLFGVLIPVLSCLTLLFAWLGWKANTQLICGTVPISDSGTYYISAQTFLREGVLDIAAQRRPLNIMLTSLWLFLSGDNFKSALLIQAVGFSVAAFLATAVVAAMHGIRAGLLWFALVLVLAEPYLPTTLSESNGIIFGILSLVGFLFGVYRRNLFAYCCGAFFLAMGLAIRPSALFVLPCVIVAGGLIFRGSRARLVAVLALLTAAILLPSGISILMNRAMRHGEGGFYGNLSYTIYGLVAGGKGWGQYEKDYPHTLDGLAEAARSRVIVTAAQEHFKEHPIDLARGLIKGQVLGPVQTFAQFARLAFLGAAGDPLRIIPGAAIIVISLGFAGVLWCFWASGSQVVSSSRSFRLFCIWILTGYLTSIPYFYEDGGLRLHAPMVPIVAYMLVWAMLPRDLEDEDALANRNADRLLAGTTLFGFLLLGLVGWVAFVHPKSDKFDVIPISQSLGGNNILFWFRAGWPQCDLRTFARVLDDKPHWFSGAIPDDNFRSAGIREIAGQGNLYLGFDPSARLWKIIQTDKPIGSLNKLEVGSGKNRDFYPAETVQVIGIK